MYSRPHSSAVGLMEYRGFGRSWKPRNVVSFVSIVCAPHDASVRFGCGFLPVQNLCDMECAYVAAIRTRDSLLLYFLTSD